MPFEYCPVGLSLPLHAGRDSFTSHATFPIAIELSPGCCTFALPELLTHKAAYPVRDSLFTFAPTFASASPPCAVIAAIFSLCISALPGALLFDILLTRRRWKECCVVWAHYRAWRQSNLDRPRFWPQVLYTRRPKVRSRMNDGMSLTVCSAAEVTVGIRNRGEDAFRPEVFGDTINVTRTILAQGASTYKLQDSNGKVVSRKRADMTAMCDHLNIQVDNPLTVLTQGP